MKKSELDQALITMNFIRKEKTPQTAAYCILMSLAKLSDEPDVGVGKIRELLDEASFGGGTFDRLVDKNLITKTKKGHYDFYTLTPAGWDEVRRIVAGQIQPSPQDIRKAELAKLVAAARA